MSRRQGDLVGAQSVGGHSQRKARELPAGMWQPGKHSGGKKQQKQGKRKR